jgi:hypothetical protein
MPPEDGLWYFASPYSVTRPDGGYDLAAEEANFRLACIYAARLLDAGWLLFCPVAMTHPIHCTYAPFLARQEHKLWYALDNAIIRTVPFRGILLAPGWEHSTGCVAEKILFEELGRAVRYLHEPCLVTEDP